MQKENSYKFEGKYLVDPVLINLDCPQQSNGVDCGVFVIAAVVSILHNAEATFSNPLNEQHLMYSQYDIKRFRENILQYMILQAPFI